MSLFVERTKAKHDCRNCKRPMLKGEARLVYAFSVGTRLGTFWRHWYYCLECSAGIIDANKDDLRYAEENQLRAQIKQIYSDEKEKYVAKALVE